eukprot:scaffold584_cov338-Pavlova_lutheri.AAC.42
MQSTNSFATEFALRIRKLDVKGGSAGKTYATRNVPTNAKHSGVVGGVRLPSCPLQEDPWTCCIWSSISATDAL